VFGVKLLKYVLELCCLNVFISDVVVVSILLFIVMVVFFGLY